MYSSYRRAVNSAIDYMPENREILFIKTTYPNILEELLLREGGSEKLRRWLGLDKQGDPIGSFSEAIHNGYGMNLIKHYSETYAVGSLNFSEKAAYAQIPVLSNQQTEFSYLLQSKNPQGEKEYVKLKVKRCQKGGNPSSDSSVTGILNSKEYTYECTLEPTFYKLPKDKFFFLEEVSAIPDVTLARMIRAFLLRDSACRHAKLILTASTNCIPKNLADYVQLVELGVPTFDDLCEDLKQRLIRENEKKQCPFSEEQLKVYARRMCGLTSIQIDSLYTSIRYTSLRYAIESGNFDQKIWREKETENKKTGLMEFRRVDTFPGVVGCGEFLRWLNTRLPYLVNPDLAIKTGFIPPRGVILAGVPGTGKTQLAKQVAYLWAHYNETTHTIDEKEHRPVSMIVFRLGDLTAKHLGESQEKMRLFLERLSVQDKVVLFVDEVEKHMFQETANRTMHETMKQMMSMFLDWLQEHKENVFTFMTCNDISILPPELIRSGRISGRFFVHMPNEAELMSMLYVFLRKSFFDGNKQSRNIVHPEFEKLIKQKCNVIDRYTMYYGTKGEAYDRNLDQNLEKEMQDGVLSRVFDDLAVYGRENHRTPFMTGSDLDELVKDTCILLDKEEKLKGCTAEEFAEAMIRGCCNERFIPYGQSSLDKVVQVFHDCGNYNNISAKPLLPPFDARTGLFRGDNRNENQEACKYDKFLRKTLIEEIEKSVRKNKLEEQKQDNEVTTWEEVCKLQNARRKLELKKIAEEEKNWEEECKLQNAHRKLQQKKIAEESDSWEKDTYIRKKRQEYDRLRLDRELNNWDADVDIQERQKELQMYQIPFQYAQMVKQYEAMKITPANLDELGRKSREIVKVKRKR